MSDKKTTKMVHSKRHLELNKTTVTNSQLTKNQEGKIYLSNCQKEDILSYDLINFNIFDQKGVQVDLPKERKDDEYSFCFDFGKLKFDGETVEIAGDFQSFNTIGYLFDSLAHFSRETEQIIRSNCHIFGQEMGFYARDSKLKKYVETADVSNFAYFTLIFAGIQFGDDAILVERIQPFVNLLVYSLFLDDEFESAKGVRATWNEADSTLFWDICEALILIVKGNHVPDPINRNILSKCPSFKLYCDVAIYLRKSFINVAVDETKAQHWIDSLCNTLQSYALESLAFSPVTTRVPRMSEIAFKYVRNVSVTVDIAIESMCLLGELYPSKETRNNVLFKLFNHLCCSHSALLNDIFSIKKEVKKGEEVNLILIKNKKMKLDEAFKETLKELQDVVQDFKQLKNLAIKLHGENKDLDKYIKYCEGWMIGHCMWLGSVSRYGDRFFNITL